jgi:PAS domain S-box-containing protein
MTAGERLVLCVSTDEAFATRTSRRLDDVSPSVTVEGVADVEAAIDRIDTESVDGVVTDGTTALSRGALFRTLRQQYPQPAVAVSLPFATDEGDQVALADLIDFADVVDDDGSSGPLDDWLRETVCPDSDRVSDPTALVDEIKRALVDTTDPADIEAAVCARLAGDRRFAFAWIGEYDRGERRVVPWATASAVGDWPTAQTFEAESGSAIKRVLCSRELVHVAALDAHEGPLPWRSAAGERGCQSLVLVPLCSQDELVGVMGVYATDGFDEATLTALGDVGSATGDVLGGMVIRDRIEQQGRSLRQYERLVETAGDGMYTLDTDGHFVTVNDTLLSMTGYNREGILGEPWTLLVDTTDAVSIGDAIERLRATEEDETWTFEAEIHRKDGSTFSGENKIALLEIDGAFEGTVGVLRDVTERKERERELERQNERVEAFASIVSHDLRNPLGVAKGYLERDTHDQEAIDESLAAVERMETIIDDVLALARHGDAATDTGVHELRTIATDAWRTVETKSARLVVGSSGAFVLDRSRVLRLFENCIRNAVEHGGEDVVVSVGRLSDSTGTGPPGGFYIADDGSGLDPELKQVAFDSSVTTADSGHGLGLWIVREVSRAHGWTVSVTDSAAGGARFEFTDVSSSSDRAE